MNTLGWVFMITSWTVIISVLILCLFWTLRPPKRGDDQVGKP